MTFFATRDHLVGRANVLLHFSDAAFQAMRRRKSRSFDSAEVRSAQDDRPIFDMSIGDRTLAGFNSLQHEGS